MTGPRRGSLRWRLAAWSFATTALAAGLLAYHYQRSVREITRKEAEDRLSTLAHHVAASALLGALAHSEELLADLLESAVSRPDVLEVAVFDADGKLVAARGGRSATELAVADAESCRPCDPGGGRQRWILPVARRERLAGAGGVRGDDVEQDGPYAGPPPAARSERTPAGWMVLDASTERWQASQRRLAVQGLLIAGTALVIAFVVALLLAQRLTSPLRELARASKEIGRGRWDTRLPSHPAGEIGQLTEDFSAMAAALASLDRENRAYREQLEQMVASRTRELEQAYERMKGMADAKDQFVSTVSHDFRSPLAIILSNIQTVLADPGMTPETRSGFLGRAERHCRRLGALVNDLLDLARIENREALFERVALSELVREEVENHRPSFEEKRVSLLYDTPLSTLMVPIDKGQVTRALHNLLDNARKFTLPGGRVCVRLSSSDEPGMARLSVTDTGPGIPPGEREHLFERFFQGRSGIALGSGSGLGLAIVGGVARCHRGRVGVAGAPGGGTTFHLDLPLDQPTT